MKSWLTLAAASTLVFPVTSWAQADSVSGGRAFTGKSKAIIVSTPSNPKNEPAGLTYLLSGVLLQSSTMPYANSTIRFGQFKNRSQYVLTISLAHVGGGSNHHINAYVDGATVGHTDGDFLVFQVPQGASYSWELKNEHTITASVPSYSRLSLDTGLPLESAFRSPTRTGQYVGCRSDGPSENYYYTVSPMTDGSDIRGGPVETAEFGTVVVGPRPDSPGECFPVSHLSNQLAD